MVRLYFRVSRIVLAGLVVAGALTAENVPVRHPEGVVRGFLVLRPPGGAVIANGDLIQFTRGDRVTTRLVFHFKDGSLQDETAVFSQRRQFRLLTDHLVQRGPSFPRPQDVSIDATSGRVVVKHRDKDGEEKTIDEKMELPADLANGMVITLLKNLSRDAPATTVSMLFATPKPQLVKLVITRLGQEPFSVGRASYKATAVQRERRDRRLEGHACEALRQAAAGHFGLGAGRGGSRIRAVRGPVLSGRPGLADRARVAGVSARVGSAVALGSEVAAVIVAATFHRRRDPVSPIQVRRM